MIAQNELSGEEMRATMQEVAQEHLPFAADGYVVREEMIYDVLMKAATEGISLDAACRDLETSAAGNTIREIVNEQLTAEQLRQYEANINAALGERLPQQILKKKLEAAIDEHDEPFYGKTPELKAYTRRSRAKKGTTHFFRIASAYVSYRQMRLTIAVTFVLPDDETVDVVRRLHQQLQAHQLRIGALSLDRGFCCGAVIRYLQAHNQPAVLACTIRGTKGGTRQLCRGRKSYRTTYTFTDGTTADMAVVATLVPARTTNAGASGCSLSSSASTGSRRRSPPAIAPALASSPPTASCAASASKPAPQPCRVLGLRLDLEVAPYGSCAA